MITQTLGVFHKRIAESFVLRVKKYLKQILFLLLNLLTGTQNPT